MIVKLNAANTDKSPCLSVDPFKRHVTAFDPIPANHRPAQLPKSFAFDAIFMNDDSTVGGLGGGGGVGGVVHP